jgi:hypothetical protein
MAGGNHNNNGGGGRRGGTGAPKVLNVAEKPSVARALAGVLASMQGSQDRGMRREGAQIFTHENVTFPSVFSQGEGRMIHGPSTLRINFNCIFIAAYCRVHSLSYK